MKILGVDPGASGAVAVLVDGELVDVFDTPTVTAKGKARVSAAAFAAAVRALQPVDHAYIEQVAAMPGQGVSSMFAFGMACGIVWGVLGALAVPMTAVSASQWKQALRVPAAKRGARARASELMPRGASLWPLEKHHGRAEAALIALYGMRLEGGNREISW